MRRFAVSRLRSQFSKPTFYSFSFLSNSTITATPVSDQSIYSNQFAHSPTTNNVHGSEYRLRKYTSNNGEADHSKEIDEINLKFAEAREEIESAMDSKETVYFDEEAECARDAVQEVLDLFNGLLAKLPDKEKGALQRSMGLKIEQLKAELAQLND